MIQEFSRFICQVFLSISLLVAASSAWAQNAGQEQHSGVFSAQTATDESAEETRPVQGHLKCPTTNETPCIPPSKIKELQISLNNIGFDTGPADGVFGPAHWMLSMISARP